MPYGRKRQAVQRRDSNSICRGMCNPVFSMPSFIVAVANEHGTEAENCEATRFVSKVAKCAICAVDANIHLKYAAEKT